MSEAEIFINDKLDELMDVDKTTQPELYQYKLGAATKECSERFGRDATIKALLSIVEKLTNDD